VVRIDPVYFRPTDGRSSDRRCQQGPAKARLEAENVVRQLVKEMVAADRAMPSGRWPMAKTPFELKGKTVFAGHCEARYSGAFE